MCACRADPALLLAATSGLLLAGLTDELAGLLRRDAPVGVVLADAHGRGQRAGAYAVHRLQSEEHVGGGVADGDVKLLGERLGHQRRAGHVAGGAHAHVDDVLADRQEPELGVEAGHAEHPRERQMHLAGDLLEGRARQPAERVLRGVEGLDETGAVADLGHHRVEELHVDLGHEPGRLLAHDARRSGPAAFAGQRSQRGGAFGRDVERELLELGAVVDLDAVHRADTLAQGARVAAVAAVLGLHQVEQAEPLALVDQLAALEVDALEDFVEGGALGPRCAPNESARSMTPTTLTCSSALAYASCGKGRKARTRTMPALTPCERSLSTAMRVVPAVEPTTTMAISASSRRYGSSRP